MRRTIRPALALLVLLASASAVCAAFSPWDPLVTAAAPDYESWIYFGGSDPKLTMHTVNAGSYGVGFDVAKLFPDGEVRKETFWVSVGQEIGGVSKDADTGEVLNFRTGLVMVDFHRAVLLPGVGVSDRVIYADQEGNLDFRLRAKTDSDLWKMLEADHPMEAHKLDSKGVYAMGRSPDAYEGVQSFLEKRPADFKMKVSCDMPAFFPWWRRRSFSE